MSIEHVELHCETCDLDTSHELHYAGRLLESTRCTRCGSHLEVNQRTMLPAYAHDLEKRILSKPGRMLRRARKDPWGYLRSLPGAVVRQPVKFVREFSEVLRRRG